VGGFRLVFELADEVADSGRIFHADPVIPPELRIFWDLDCYMRGDGERSSSEGAVYLTNIQQLYERPTPESTEPDVMTDVLGPIPSTGDGEVDGFDVAYFDPPYNQHPYGSNYFMLNLLVNYEEPEEISEVSGIPTSWRRSGYNVRSKALPLLYDLISTVDASFVILSFNDEGFVSPAEIREVLNELGNVTEQRQPHATFRGCRNLRNRSFQVTEHVYLIEKG